MLLYCMGGWKHRILDHTETLVLCEHCGWVRRTDKQGRPKCSVKRKEERGYDHHAKVRGVFCEICGAVDKLVVDHNHECCPGKFGCDKCIRGTLCHSCNIELGFIERARKRGTLDGLLAW